jgi:thioredoxin reductase (NADPH)
LKTINVRVNGEGKVTSITADGKEIPCDGVFILRQTIAPSSLLPGLETEKGHIKVDKSMKTNIPGVFAAGDCIGTPYQVVKAAGEGQIAALSAVEFLSHE